MASFDKKNPVEERVKLTNVQRLMNIINNRRDSGKQQPFGFPETQQEFAQMFIKFLEPRMKHEVDIGNDLPYQERIASCMIAYYRLNQGDQKYLHHLREKSVWWRGDSIQFMRKREKVTLEFLADKGKLRNMLSNMVHGKKN